MARRVGSEPSAWTGLFWIDEEVFRTRVLGFRAPDTEPGYRNVIKSGMREGDVVGLPSIQQRFVHRFADSGIRQVGVVVALLEEDEFPSHVVRSAYRTFVREFPGVVGNFVVNNLREPEDAERDELIDQIKDEILATIKDALTLWKPRISSAPRTATISLPPRPTSSTSATCRSGARTASHSTCR